MIRAGIVTGAVVGMNAQTCASAPSGFPCTAKPRNSEIRISNVSGVVVLCSSSWRGTIAPATANAAA